MSGIRDQSSDVAALSATNIGGIDTADVEFVPGVNVLTGSNATNRSSLLRALIGALGGSNVSLKADAEEGEATLSLDGGSHTRLLTRRGSNVATSGDPLLEEAEVADLFAFLMESNEARRRVAHGGDLRELIMSPVDTEEIQNEIDQLKQERDEIETEIANIDEREKRLPELVQRQTSVREEIEQQESQLETLRSDIEKRDTKTNDHDEKKHRVEERLDEKQELESTREEIEFELETQRESLASLRTEHDEIESELDDVPDVADSRLRQIESQLTQARTQQKSVKSTVNQLQNIIQFNEERLETEEREEIFSNLQRDDDEGGGFLSSLRSQGNADLLGAFRREYETEGSVTDQLVDDYQILTCWTCGSRVKRTRIQQIIEELRDVREEQLDVLDSIESNLESLQAEKQELERAGERRDRLEREAERLTREIEDRRERIAELESEHDALTQNIDDLSADIDRLRADIKSQEDDYSTVLELKEQAKRVEIELEQSHEQLTEVENEIDAIEDRVEQRNQLETRRSSIRDTLDELRQTVEQIEREAVDEFNDRMADILGILDYSNIERIWIERTNIETGGIAEQRSTQFDLHIVRTTQEGSSYRDTVDHLSESEREVTGLIFALAGYLTHEVHESMPFMVLDSLEAIDSERIAHLVDYLSKYPTYLVVALLPEDAAALDDDYRYLSPPW
ncbi:archaea-specific SMC-related protein [Haloplanus halobius]|uniref:archaea-specific SMC-related protein n=1 Tax=Haloplanus halobius TaxID=2934938 RepID=UPI00200ED294|nr:archaea-specific SMC-related protein [Haloplanus sp. XH21]